MSTPAFTERLLAVATRASTNAMFRDVPAMVKVRVDACSGLGAAQADLPGEETIADAVRAFRSGRRMGAEQLSLCAAGAWLEVDGHRILESREETDRLLALAMPDRHAGASPSLRRRRFLELTRSYFLWSPNDRGATSTPWSALRSTLNATIDGLAREDGGELWERLFEHRNVFLPNPCARYAGLAVDSEEIGQLRADFQIPPDSWFLDELFRASVDEACKADDRRFREDLDGIVEELGYRPPDTVDWALARLLERYADASYRTEINDALCKSAVDTWQTPRDRANWPKWSGVSDGTREMVSRWLVGRILENVFDVFASLDPEGKARERADYWLTWKAQIRDIWVLAGSGTGVQQRFAAARILVGDSAFRSLDGNSKDVSALIMFLGDYAFVEFSHKGNGLYLYRVGGHAAGDLPFDLSGRRPLLSSPVVEDGARNNGRQVKDRVSSLKVTGSDGKTKAYWTHSGDWDSPGGEFDWRMERNLRLRR